MAIEMAINAVEMATKMEGVFLSDKWKDYQIIDAGNGEKLERWGTITVIRPDPQIIWPPLLLYNKNSPNISNRKDIDVWQNAHMRYHRSKSGGGHWESLKKATVNWTVTYDDMTFNIRPTDFKHMGLFPEQAANWDWAANLISCENRPIRVLNLFGYTGGATVACLKSNAEVTHVDAAKGMNQWAKENIRLSGLSDLFNQSGKLRILTDDVFKFVQREARRGHKYDAIIMDPPSYGRGPSGEVWKLENRLFELIRHCVDILSDKPLFMLVNTYTAGFTHTATENILKLSLFQAGYAQPHIIGGTLGLPISNSGLILPCGTCVRVTFA